MEGEGEQSKDHSQINSLPRQFECLEGGDASWLNFTANNDLMPQQTKPLPERLDTHEERQT
ncbi:hypothetical protein GIB67_026029 [Kingdonia uniflora]|uniref:Uncharacterized protein n=1 Tax=Kingdonia uniflora TaxID=39325 RepID=A0A7J7M2S8_9MAGN|nr:hypothetical protein GIB67_026029 [Kingdonia uniflora]